MIIGLKDLIFYKKGGEDYEIVFNIFIIKY